MTETKQMLTVGARAQRNPRYYLDVEARRGVNHGVIVALLDSVDRYDGTTIKGYLFRCDSDMSTSSATKGTWYTVHELIAEAL